MEEIESPVEHLSEELNHIGAHAKENWLKLSALLSAILAVLAAIAGMQSGREVNEAMIQQIKASDAWNYYQAKGIKAMIVEMEAKQDQDYQKKLEKYHEEQQSIKKDAEAKALSSEQHLHAHETLSRAVTLFQVGIAMVAISVLTRRKRFLIFSLALGIGGLIFFAQYFLQ